MSSVPVSAESNDTNVTTPPAQYNDIVPVAAESSEVTVTQAPPKFVITDVSPSSVTVNQNQQFSINVNVENTGNASGDVEVRLINHNGSIVDSKTITLDPSQGQVVGLNGVAPSNPGSYSWKVEAYNKSTNNVDDSKTVTINVQATTATTPTKTKKSMWWLWLVLGGGLLLLFARKEKK